MVNNNNPFRAKTNSSVPQDVADWGKNKFKPNKFGGGNKKPFKRHSNGGGSKPFNKNFDGRKGNFNKNKETNKFNQVARDAKPENATPWNQYKDEFVFKQREEEQAAMQCNMDSIEAKNVLKQREINHRKLLIEQKKHEPTQWEDFGDDNGQTKSNKQNICLKNQNSNNNEKEDYRKKLKNIHQNKKIKFDTKSKTKFKKNISNSELKADVKDFISKELLDNFDSKKLTFQQNDKLRSVITKTTTMAYGTTIACAVKDMKRQKEKKNKFKQ